MADEDETDDDPPPEEDLPSLIAGMRRSNRRLAWALIGVLVTSLGTAIGGILVMYGEVDAVAGEVRAASSKQQGDLGRLQEQTTTMRIGIDTLHSDLQHVSAQVDRLVRGQTAQ